MRSGPAILRASMTAESSAQSLDELARLLGVTRSYHDGKNRWSLDGLSHELGMPGIAIARIVHALEGAQLITVTEDEHLLPARDLGKISLQEVIDIARNEKAGQVGWRNLKLPAIDGISARMDEAWRKSCGDMTLRDLVEDDA